MNALPDPTWTDCASICCSCGYPLDGMPAPWKCPECGAAYEARQLVLFGVPRVSSAGSPLAKLLWIVAIVDAIALTMFWPIILMLAWPVLVLMVIVLLAILIRNVMFGRRERAGVERFVITPTGIARMPLKPDRERNDSVFLAFGGANDVELTQVSDFWARIRVGTRRGGRLADVMFDAGVRCPRGRASDVAQHLAAFLKPLAPAAPAIQ